MNTIQKLSKTYGATHGARRIMATSIVSHRRARYAMAATGLVGTLLALSLDSASAMPGRGDNPTVPDRAAHARGHYVEHACFITPLTWNEALGGPLPRCYTYLG